MDLTQYVKETFFENLLNFLVSTRLKSFFAIFNFFILSNISLVHIGIKPATGDNEFNSKKWVCHQWIETLNKCSACYI